MAPHELNRAAPREAERAPIIEAKLAQAFAAPWRVPDRYVQLARDAMGGLDFDLSVLAYAAMEQAWRGRVFVVTPAPRAASCVVDKLLLEYGAGNISQAILLTNNATETRWFARAHRASALMCLPKGRIRFTAQNGSDAFPVQGQAVMYFGDRHREFAATFGRVGVVLRLLETAA